MHTGLFGRDPPLKKVNLNLEFTADRIHRESIREPFGKTIVSDPREGILVGMDRFALVIGPTCQCLDPVAGRSQPSDKSPPRIFRIL